MALTKEAADKLTQKAKKYLPDVSNAYAYDPKSGELIFKALALTDSSVEMPVTQNKQRAGQGNAVQYMTYTDREVNVTMTAIDYNMEYFAVNIGNTIRVGKFNITSGEAQIQAEDGKLIMPVKPFDTKVAVDINDQTITLNAVEEDGKWVVDLTAYDVTDECITVVYLYEGDAQILGITANTPPTIVKLVLETPIYNNLVGKTGSLQYHFERFQFNGNVTINQQAGNSSTFDLSGSALATKSMQCDGQSVYGYIVEITTDINELYNVYAIIAKPNKIELAVDEDETIEVYGKRGAELTHDLIKLDPSVCEFTTEDTTYATVGKNDGKVHGVQAGNATIKVTHGKLEATVSVEVIAGE